MQKSKLILVGMSLLLMFFTFGCGEDSQSVNNEKVEMGTFIMKNSKQMTKYFSPTLKTMMASLF